MQAFPDYWTRYGLLDRLRNYKPKYENPHYGIHALWLKEVFPIHERFIVRPQPRLANLAHNFAGPQSTRRDSRGARVSKNLTGATTPDHEVVWVTPDNTLLISVLVTDTKADWEELAKDKLQLADYQTRLTHGAKHYDDGALQNIRAYHTPVQGLLMVGNKARLYGARGEKCEAIGDLDDLKSDFYQKILEIRQKFIDHLVPPIPAPLNAGQLPNWFDPWLRRFSTDESAPEGSVYGPGHEILYAKYHPSNGHVIKSQAMLGKKALPGADPTHVRTNSLGSEEYLQYQTIQRFPDFLVVTTTGMVDGRPSDTVVFVCEMKRPMDRPGKADKLFLQVKKDLDQIFILTGNAYVGLAVIGMKAWLLKPKVADNKLVLTNGLLTFDEPDFNDTNSSQDFADLSAPFWDEITAWVPMTVT